MSFRNLIVSINVLALIALSSTAHGQDMIYSGFMTDYSQLEKISDGSADYRYIAPGAEEKLARYTAVMIDQPEIFIANDSEYRGAKPKQLGALAEALRAGVAEAMSGDVYLVDRPGKNVLYMSLAISNLKLSKKKRKALGYLPVALVAGAVKGAKTTDIAKKADFRGAVLELEAFDSISGERLVAIIDSRGSDKANPESWEELEELAALYGRRLRCRFNNASLPAGQRENCLIE